MIDSMINQISQYPIASAMLSFLPPGYTQVPPGAISNIYSTYVDIAIAQDRPALAWTVYPVALPAIYAANEMGKFGTPTPQTALTIQKVIQATGADQTIVLALFHAIGSLQATGQIPREYYDPAAVPEKAEKKKTTIADDIGGAIGRGVSTGMKQVLITAGLVGFSYLVARELLKKI